MEGYGYQYPGVFPGPRSDYPDRGDGTAEYGLDMSELGPRRSRSRQRSRKARSRSRSDSKTKTYRDRSKSRSHSRSRTRSRTRSRSNSHSRSHSGSATPRKLIIKEPGFLDAFRVLYLTPSKHKKSTTKYLATKKRQDSVQEYLKSDGLGSKRWLFYPRNRTQNTTTNPEETASSASCDRRVKIDGEFFRKYRRSKKVDIDAPIAKLKRWELVLYKKLGFVQAV